MRPAHVDARALARVAALTLLTLAACSSPGAPEIERMVLTSPAIGADGRIPDAHTCDGADEPIPLRWSGAPAGTRSFAVTMRDPDAPGGDFIHWVVTGIDAAAHPAGWDARAAADAGDAAANDFGRPGYDGPCPPEGETHEYVIQVHAFTDDPMIPADADARAVLRAIEDARADTGTVRAVYGR